MPFVPKPSALAEAFPAKLLPKKGCPRPVRKVRCLILSVVCTLSVANAQGVEPAAQRAASAPAAASLAGSASTGFGLRVSPGLRIHQVGDEALPAFLEADQIDGDDQGVVTLTGNAQVRRMDAILKGDVIKYRRETGDLDAQGSVRLLRDATLITGPGLKYNIDADTGELDEPVFRLGTNGGSGSASHALILSRSRMRLKDVIYTGCPCPNPSWEIRSKQVDLDFDRNEGVARNGVLYFKDVPILASPYLTFPVKRERKSGFLLPTYGTSSQGGIDIMVPYYVNLAPNYDMTLMPRYMSKRGVQAGGEFRYLGRSYAGRMTGTYLNNDHQTGTNRWMYSTVHRHLLPNGFFADWDISRVSDINYFRDFSSLGLNESTTSYLRQRGRLGWTSRYVRSYVQVYKYQSLYDDDAVSRNPQYDKEPELVVKAARYNWGGFDLELDSAATRFRKPMGEQLIAGSWQDKRFGPDGERLVAYPSISYPIVRSGWYITPKAGVHMSRYQTRWHASGRDTSWASSYRDSYDNYYGAPDDGSVSRVQPIFSVDAGMTFDRDTTLFGKPSLQTLEPRVYYLRVPYREQSSLPVYDTNLSDFSFSQAFQENIYSGGWDRIVNADQVTLGLTTRFLDADTGFERLSLSGAQRIYFEDQRVTLPREVARTDVRSEFLLGATAALTDTLSTQAALQYNPYETEWDRAMIGLRWKPQRLTMISAAYRYQRDHLTEQGTRVPYSPRGQNQISIAFQWPFTDRIYGVGRVDYSLRRAAAIGSLPEERPRVTQAILGLEYKGDCCWTGRVVFQRYAVDANDSNTAVFFQLELNGLGSLGTDPMDLLSRSVPGYESINPPIPAATTFERYE